MSTRPRYVYRIESDLFGNGWRTLVGEQDGSLEYMRGRFSGFRESGGPRPAFRLVRIDPADPTNMKVIDEQAARTELSVGIVPQASGYQWPAYANAAARALRVASADARAAARRDGTAIARSERFARLADELEAMLAPTGSE